MNSPTNPQDNVPGEGGKALENLGTLCDHTIELSVSDEWAVPAMNAVVALVVGWLLTFWAPLTGNPQGQGVLGVLVCIAAIIAFWSSRKEHRKFTFYMHALADRHCEWSGLRITDGEEAAEFETSLQAGAILDDVQREGDFCAPAEEYVTQSAAVPSRL